MKVFVYRNLHKNKFSVRGPEGRVVAHLENLILKNVRFCVGKKGREKVLQTKQKNVHAGLRGIVIPYLDFDPSKNPYNSFKVYYNPYKNETFVKGDESPIYKSDFASLTYVNGKPVIYAIN